jgi:hypothetical protein
MEVLFFLKKKLNKIKKTAEKPFLVQARNRKPADFWWFSNGF